ncbi:MAG: hypothetical protein ACK476_19330 [Fluviicola sp.]|jgi:hypothetical protein
MKKTIVLSFLSLAFLTFSCKKNECHECHYEKDGAEVEIGEKCGDDLENAEENGIVVDGTTYEVHCHEH